MELEGSLNRFQALLVGLQEHVEDQPMEQRLLTCHGMFQHTLYKSVHRRSLARSASRWACRREQMEVSAGFHCHDPGAGVLDSGHMART